LVNKIKLKLKFTCRKKISVGSGKESSPAADITFMRVNGKLFIPGSTVKGALRTNLLLIADILGLGNPEKSKEPSKIALSDDVVSSLFGKPGGGPPKLLVSPCYPDENSFVLNHVSIDDATATASEGSLYSAEYLPPGSTFLCEIIARDLNSKEFYALLASIAATNYSRFGRDGWIEVKIDLDESEIPTTMLQENFISNILEDMAE
jgi:CRISPR/Cas system CSM-associated protein Csm3 (group 7 of RAMP superfamily)